MARQEGGPAATPGAVKRKLFKAAKTGDTTALREAIAEGADVHSVDGNKWTALHEACRSGRREVVEVLLGAGADPNAMHRDNGFTPLIVATFDPAHAEVVRALLRGGAAASLATPHGMTPLVSAASNAGLDAVAILLEAGADPRSEGDLKGEKLLACARDPELRRRIEALLEQHSATPRQTAEEARRAALLTQRPAEAEPYMERPALPLDQVRLKGAPRPVEEASLQRLKRELAPALPTGYEEMMRSLGPGTLCKMVRVQGPAAILRERVRWRERIAEYWFWGNGPLLSKGAAQGAVRIADTVDGDELVFLPAEPDTLLLLPREDGEVRLASRTGLLAALTRLLAGEDGRAPTKLSYEPVSDLV